MTEHLGTTTNEFGSSEWRAECSCGWRSGLLFSSAAADAALSAHYASLPEMPW